MNNYIVTIGGTALDDFFEVEGFPGAGDLVRSKYIESKVGGCILNFACAASSLGNDVYEVEHLKANDSGTKLIVDTMNKFNVKTDYLVINENISNSKCFIMLHENEKTIYVVENDNPCLEVDSKLEDLLNNASYIYGLMNSCHSLFPSLEALKTAKKHGAKIVFDAGSQYSDAYEKDMLYELASGCFLNTMAYQRLKDISDKEPTDILLENGADFICITNGSKGVTCYTKDKIYKEDAMKVDVIDSTGAGDCFAGCFVSCLNKGYSYEKALKMATINGAYACSVMGGNAGATTEENLLRFANKKF